MKFPTWDFDLPFYFWIEFPTQSLILYLTKTFHLSGLLYILLVRVLVDHVTSANLQVRSPK